MGVSAQRKAALRCIRNSKNRIGEWLHSSSFFLCVLESHSLIGHPVGYFAVPADSRRTHRDSKNDRGHGDLPPTASIAFTLEDSRGRTGWPRPISDVDCSETTVRRTSWYSIRRYRPLITVPAIVLRVDVDAICGD